MARKSSLVNVIPIKKKALTEKTIENLRAYLQLKRSEYMERAFGYFEPDELYRAIVGENYDVLMTANKLWRTTPQSTSISFNMSPAPHSQEVSYTVTFKGYSDGSGPSVYLIPNGELTISIAEMRTDGTQMFVRMMDTEMEWQESYNAFCHLMTHYVGQRPAELAMCLNYCAPWVADIYAEHPDMFGGELPSVCDTLRLRTQPKTAPTMPRSLLEICRRPQTLLAQLKILISANAPRCKVGSYQQAPGTAGISFSVSSTRVATAFEELAEARYYSRYSQG